jgi:serine phosphatase RsbU (regulator of sigma subunit)
MATRAVLQATVSLTVYTIAVWILLSQQSARDVLVTTINSTLERTHYASKLFPVETFEALAFLETPEKLSLTLEDFRRNHLVSTWSLSKVESTAEVSVLAQQNGQWIHFASTETGWSGKPWELGDFRTEITRGRIWGNFMLKDSEYLRQRVEEPQIRDFRALNPEWVHVHTNLGELLTPAFHASAAQRGYDFTNAHLVFIVKPQHTSPVFLEVLFFIGKYLVLCYVVMVPIMYLVARRLTKRTRQLHEVMSTMAEGDLQARANISGNDEIGQLADHLNGMVAALEDRQRLRAEVKLAGELQRGLLPTTPPCPSETGFEIAQLNRMSNRVGGDFFDYQCDGKTLTIVVGDISGHGLESGLMMAASRTALRLILRREPSPRELLRQLNVELKQDLSSGHFLTLAVMQIDLGTGNFWHISAGHEPTLWRRANGEITLLLATTTPLGLFKELPKLREPVRGNIAPGEMFLLSTDGLRESFNPAEEQLGLNRIKARLSECTSAQALVEDLVNTAETHREGIPMEDDLTLVALRRPTPEELLREAAEQAAIALTRAGA